MGLGVWEDVSPPTKAVPRRGAVRGRPVTVPSCFPAMVTDSWPIAVERIWTTSHAPQCTNENLKSGELKQKWELKVLAPAGGSSMTMNPSEGWLHSSCSAECCVFVHSTKLRLLLLHSPVYSCPLYAY